MRTLGQHPVAAPALALAMIAALCGCADKPLKPAQVSGTVQATAQVNPSPSQRPSPLLIRVYELKSDAAFNNADFMSLYQRDQAELAADMLAKDEYVLAPGESKAFAKQLSPDTRFIGVVAAYRDLEHATWRSIVTIQPNKPQLVTIRANALAIEATSSLQVKK